MATGKKIQHTCKYYTEYNSLVDFVDKIEKQESYYIYIY